MSEFEKLLQEVAAMDQSAPLMDLDRLTELVESQISNVIGGGYSQYYSSHDKDAYVDIYDSGHNKDAS
ncbi:hypothetical protein JOD97_002605 [Duganella sp. 1411]|uniref:hypothetical protein n=1 Tax=Duganella sp. 1411 TaxID=2806572 RepID=UPI001AE141B4|nr:hypothetical protein [Duganella sp. 1411]MBP1204563.1 hypothetical protein [Duganella sp. 1411]